jgi:hypothetical protein
MSAGSGTLYLKDAYLNNVARVSKVIYNINMPQADTGYKTTASQLLVADEGASPGPSNF